MTDVDPGPAGREPIWYAVVSALADDDCCADDLPGDVDETGRLVLIRTLLAEGLLTLSSTADA